MGNSVGKKIAQNTIYIYIGLVLCTMISLCTVPVLLKNLGVNDYGIYNLVAGVIAMLSFFKGSMIVTVQRFMNVAYGEGNVERVNKIFTVSLVLYITAAVIIAIIVEILGPFISNGYLNIESNRINAATVLFQVLVISTVITTIMVPYDALFNVHEDLGMYSLFNVTDHLLKLISAIFIGYIFIWDRLILYAICSVSVTSLVFFIKFVICKRKYNNVTIVKIDRHDVLIVKEMLSFIGWNLYSTVAKIFSTQGFAVVLNLFMGTAINAAYGVANQINGSLSQFTTSVGRAFNPQIMKSEGMKNDDRLINLSLLSTKYSSFIYSFFAIPLITAMPFVLRIWLGKIPEYTLIISKILIISSIVSMLSVGLAPTLYAKGKIKFYLVTLGTLLILIVFMAYILLSTGMSVTIAVSLFVIIEIIMLGVRLYCCKKEVNLSIRAYLFGVFVPYFKVTIPVIAVMYFLSCDSFMDLVFVCTLSSILFLVCIYFLGFDEKERSTINVLCSRLLKRNVNEKNI